jgi:hypothetical protein
LDGRQLIDLLGKDLSVILQVKSDDAEGMKDNQAEKRVTVDLSKVTPEELLKYTTDSMNIASMFCQIGQDGSSIDILQLMLTSIYGVEAFAEIADRSTSVVYGAHIEVGRALLCFRPFFVCLSTFPSLHRAVKQQDLDPALAVVTCPLPSRCRGRSSFAMAAHSLVHSPTRSCLLFPPTLGSTLAYSSSRERL